MAQPKGPIIIDEAEAQQAAERYAQMEADMQALQQRNAELIRDLQEQQNIVAMERLCADRRSNAQTQEFANLTAELLAGRQGPQVQLDGMRLSVKVEKPENYDGDKVKDVDTWLFQVREHLELSTVCVNAVDFIVAARLVNCCLEMSWRNAHRLDKLATSTQLTHSQSTEYKEGGAHSSRRPHNAATLPGHRESPNCVDYNLVNEQEQSQPQRIHARH